MKWRRILLLTALFVAALAVTTWAVLQRSDAATVVVQRELAAWFAAPTSVDSTELDLALGRLSLHGLRLDDPTRPGQPLLRVATVRLDVDVDALGGSLQLHGVELEGVEIDLGPALPTAAQLLRPRSPGGAERVPRSVPPIRLRRGTVRFLAVAGAPAFVAEDLALEVTPITGDQRRAMITGGATVAGLAAPLHVAGTADLAAGAARIAVSLRDHRIENATLGWCAQRLGVELREIDGSGHLHELEVVAACGDGAVADGELGLRGRLSGVRIAAPGVPPQLRSADVQVQATSRDGGRATLHLTQSSVQGHIEVRAELGPLRGTPDLTLRANGRELAVDAELATALATFPLGRELALALRPTAGRGDIELWLANPHRPGGTAEFDLQLRGVAMAWHGLGEGPDRLGFPLPLVDARGRVALRDDVVLLEGLQAAIAAEAGGGRVELDGRIDTRATAGEETTLDIRAEGVAFGAPLREALDALLHDGGELYDRLAPSGTAAVTVAVRPRQQLAGGWAATIEPRNATMQWQRFPYRLEALGGTVVARADGVDFDLAGRHGDGALTLRGHLPLAHADRDGGSDGFEASVRLDGVAVDDDLREAIAVLAPSLDAPWRAAAPTGRVGGAVKVWRPGAGDALRYDARLDLAGVALALPAAPWRAQALHGPLLVQGAGEDACVDCTGIRGALAHPAGRAAQLALLGSIERGAAAREDLAFVVRGFELDAQVGTTLAQLGALGPGTWENLRPSGRVDLVCRLQHVTGSAPRIALEMQLVDVGSDAPMLPKPARRITGDLVVADGVLTFAGVRAELGGTVVTCKAGRVAAAGGGDDRTEITCEAAATGFPIDGGLANLFAEPLRSAVAARALTGRADIERLALRFLVPPAGGQSAFHTGLAGQLRLYDVAMTLGSGPDALRIEALNGVVVIADSRVGADVGPHGGALTGTLHDGSLRLFGQPFESIEAPFVADAAHLEFPAITARLHGGRVAARQPEQAAVHYLLPGATAPAGRLTANLLFERIDVFSFLAACGQQNPPYTGSASGELVLERLDGNDLVDAAGEGSLRIERGDLGVVPLFTAIYAQLPAPERPRFDQLTMKYRLADRALTFDPLNLGSNLMAANGRGSLDLDGYLDVEMKLDNLLGRSADPLLMPLIDYLTQNIVSFHLFGHLRDLHAEKRWLTQSSPRRQPLVPMPPFAERPRLPDY